MIFELTNVSAPASKPPDTVLIFHLFPTGGWPIDGPEDAARAVGPFSMSRIIFTIVSIALERSNDHLPGQGTHSGMETT